MIPLWLPKTPSAFTFDHLAADHFIIWLALGTGARLGELGLEMAQAVEAEGVIAVLAATPTLPRANGGLMQRAAKGAMLRISGRHRPQ